MQPLIFDLTPPSSQRCADTNIMPYYIQYVQVAYFDDVLVKALNYFETLCQMDNAQKAQFFKGLPQILPQFPNVRIQLTNNYNNTNLACFNSTSNVVAGARVFLNRKHKQL
jgi:hypothetical protein